MAGVRSFGAAALALLAALAVPKGAEAEMPWVVYYKDKEKPAAFAPYDLIVLDSTYHPPLRPLKDRGKTLLGYLSVGEVEDHRSWFAKVKSWGVLSEENPNWPGSFYVDVRDPRWVKLVVEDLVPALARKGFDGVFLDTLDNPPDLERRDPKRWAGMTEGAARLVRAIRHHWPDLRIMQNRGYEILPLTAPALDYVLGESVYTTWNFEAGRAELQPPEDYRFQVDALKAARAANPRLQVMTLDYWDPADAATVRDIYRRQRADGFSPYVSTVKLDRIIPEPPP